MDMPSDLKNYSNALSNRGELSASVVIDEFSGVISRYYETIDQIDSSSWHELGQESISTNMLPEVGTWLNVLESNIGVLSAACDGYNTLKGMLATLSSKISYYNSLAAIEEKTESMELELAQLKIEIESLIETCKEQISYVEGLSSQVSSISVDITVPGENNTEETYKLTLGSFVEEIGKNISKIAGLSDIEGYSQKDERWSKLPYTPNTYGDSACGPTALATVLTYCLEREVLPTETGEFEGKSYLTNEDGTKYYAHLLAGIEFKIENKMVRDVNADTVKTELLEGHPVVYGIKYKKSGHWVALTQIDENDIVTIKDPVGIYSELSLSDLIDLHKDGVPFVSFTPKDTIVSDYNDFALLTNTN